MSEILDDFRHRNSVLENITYEEAKTRLTGFYDWLKSNEIINRIIENLMISVDVDNLVKDCGIGNAPNASTPDEISALGFFFIEEIKGGTEAFNLSDQYGIHSVYGQDDLQDDFDALMEKYIIPAFNYIERELERADQSNNTTYQNARDLVQNQNPLEITESLTLFRQDHPDFDRNAFIMMQFGTTQAHSSIVDAIKNTLSKYRIEALRADDKDYHDDLFPNVLTYLYGCKFGIAVFERLEIEAFNPNVALEYGYMRALKKPICLLKDKTLNELQTDLIGKLYKPFDPQDPQNTIPEVLEKWLRDKDIITL